ncbi:DUF3429 domain-containing protein [Parvularcula maris]|uniref:DUF3429 domain-containing protein n=1 Tax=Parvularcula maris TaxID=2965077 RepID=A0A9X2LA96_9PROT|nr:DUF3429 domain-containing protein [Parvularcula maris]MCQ8185848.1 DUF3429 domain-containing protein [Parvularcula maris]
MRSIHSDVDSGALASRGAQILGFGGVIPFWLALAVQFFEPAIGEEEARVAERIVVLYALSIVSFMGGGRWVLRLQSPDAKVGSQFGGLLMAVVPPLLAWLIAFLPETVNGNEFSPLMRLFLMALLLWFQYVQDDSHGAEPISGYLRLRLMLTIGATLPLFAAVAVAPFF